MESLTARLDGHAICFVQDLVAGRRHVAVAEAGSPEEVDRMRCSMVVMGDVGQGASQEEAETLKIPARLRSHVGL